MAGLRVLLPLLSYASAEIRYVPFDTVLVFQLAAHPAAVSLDVAICVPFSVPPVATKLIALTLGLNDLAITAVVPDNVVPLKGKITAAATTVGGGLVVVFRSALIPIPIPTMATAKLTTTPTVINLLPSVAFHESPRVVPDQCGDATNDGCTRRQLRPPTVAGSAVSVRARVTKSQSPKSQRATALAAPTVSLHVHCLGWCASLRRRSKSVAMRSPSMVSDMPRSVNGLTSMPVNGSWVSFAAAGGVPREPAVPPVPALAAVSGNEQEADDCTVDFRPTTFRQGDGPISASA